MSQRSRLLAVLALTIGVAACSGSAPSMEFGKEDVAQIRQMLTDFTAAYNAKDVEKIGSFFSANAALMPPNRSTQRGADGVKGWYAGRLNEEGATDLVLEPQAIEGHGTLAFIVSTYTLNLKPASGPEGRDRGRVVWILRKLGGQWRFEWQIMASDLPPAVPPPAK